MSDVLENFYEELIKDESKSEHERKTLALQLSRIRNRRIQHTVDESLRPKIKKIVGNWIKEDNEG